MKTHKLVLLCIIAGFACKETPPGPSQPSTIQLTFEDASCTEAWLKATTTEIPATVRLLRDGQRVSVFRLLTSDSLLFDEGLLPRRAYTYQLQKLANDSSVVETSESVQLTTMDTTSHNFTWRIDTLGAVSSVLYDVAIINDTLAYAVGEMYLRDSAGQVDPILYNLATWNGLQWRIQRVSVPLCPNSTGFFPLRTVFAFSPNDIWFSGGGDMIHSDGQSFRGDCSVNPLIQGAITKIWGTSSTNLYAIGRGGTIVHHNGTSWQRMASGTTVNLTDIWGTPDGREVWACGFNDSNGGSVVLRLVNGAWQTVWDRLAPPRPPYIYASYLSSLWSPGRGEFVLVGGRFYRNSLYDINIVRNEYIYKPDGSSHIFELVNFAYRVRGTARNDVCLTGDNAMIWHWNGLTWYRYDELLSENDRLYSHATFSSMVVAVGTRYNSIFRNGLIIRGRR